MVKDEKYEIVGYIMKTVVCDKCNVEMKRGNFLATEPIQYEYQCPKCKKVETVFYDDITPQFELKKKVED